MGGAEIGLMNGSGLVVGGNLILMRSILFVKSREMHLPERWYQYCLEVHQVDSDGVLNSMSSIEIEDWTNFLGLSSKERRL